MKTNMKYEPIGSMPGGQDGAICGGLIFRFDHVGNCTVCSLETLEVTAKFTLDSLDVFKPHSNAVFFGNEKFDESDEFPILYTNLYNSYSRKNEGILCAYRITRDGDTFSSKLVQIIKIGFVHNYSLWRSKEDGSDVRPYGNFAMDNDTDKLYAFVMRDKEQVTRYFEFDMPKLADGEVCPTCGVSVVTLTEEMITAQFDGDYSHYVQGACVFEGKLYSTEGFNIENAPNLPRIQVMDLAARTQYADLALTEMGFTKEPEFIYPYGGRLYYSDCTGATFLITSIE